MTVGPRKVKPPVGEMAMVTLTYPRGWPRDGRVVKKQLKQLRVEWERRWEHCRAFWGLEFHWLIAFSPAGCGGDSSSREPGRAAASATDTTTPDQRQPTRPRMGHASGTMWGHAGKWQQKQVPDDFHHVGRWWGMWGLPKVEHTRELTAAEYELVREDVQRERGEAQKRSQRAMDGSWTLAADGLAFGIEAVRRAQDRLASLDEDPEEPGYGQ